VQGRSATAGSGSGLGSEPDPPQAADFATLRALLAVRRESADWSADLAAGLAAAAFGTMPEFAADETLQALSSGAALSVVREVIEMVISEADPAGATASPEMVDAARELIRRGEPVERLIRAYHVAHARFFELWAAEVRASVGDPVEAGAAIEQGARWTFAFVDAIGDDVASLSDADRRRWSSSAAAVRLQETRAVLAGTQMDAALSSARLGYELGLSHQAFLLWDEAEKEHEHEGRAQLAAAELVARLGPQGSLLLELEEGVMAVWATVSRDTPDDRCAAIMGQLDACVSAGTIQAGLAGFRRSHEEARAARRVAELRGDSPAHVSYGDIAALDLATRDMDLARSFTLRELGPLAGSDRQMVRLADTLRVYLESLGSPKRAAALLGVHENTATNRIHAAVELLGHGVDERVAEMLLALRLAPITRRSVPAPPDPA